MKFKVGDECINVSISHYNSYWNPGDICVEVLEDGYKGRPYINHKEWYENKFGREVILLRKIDDLNGDPYNYLWFFKDQIKTLLPAPEQLKLFPDEV